MTSQSPVWCAKNYGNNNLRTRSAINRKGGRANGRPPSDRASQADRKPRAKRNDRYHDGAPHRRCDLFRTAAARRIIGGVVELLIHLDASRVSPPLPSFTELSKHRHDLVPKR